MKIRTVSLATILVATCTCSVILARPDSADSIEVTPGQVESAALYYCGGVHQVGQLVLPISNYGIFGGRTLMVYPAVDYFTGKRIEPCEFPKGALNQYCASATLWIGGIVGTDTLVSVGADGWQQAHEFRPFADEVIVRRSTTSADPLERTFAVSEQDFLGRCTDTFLAGSPYDYFDGRPHIPLGLGITLRSFSWSIPGAEDFVIFDHTIANIGTDTIEETFAGIYVDCDISGERDDPNAHVDDISGSRYVRLLEPEYDDTLCVGPIDSVLVAWSADNNGNLTWNKTCRSITGIVMLRTPRESDGLSFNWWVSSGNAVLDFGPRSLDKLRDFRTGGTGTPVGDRNKYFLLSNGERDYSQVFTNSISPGDPVWEYPLNRTAARVSTTGGDTRYLLSCGPFDLTPGDSVPLTFAYVAGENLHSDPGNFYLLPDNPQAFLGNLGFFDLDNNVRAAVRAADIPGKDTDSDGFCGTYVTCADDTVWVTGDGVMDFHPVSRCCEGNRGNVDGGSDDLVNLADLSYLISYFLSGPGSVPFTCFDESNVDGIGRIDIHDLSLLIAYLRATQPLTSPASCQ